jgi:putative tricarboxylic transport membrane protein
MKSFKGDVQLAIGVIVVAAIYLYMDMRLPEVRLGDPLGPKAFPALVGVGLIAAALLLLFEHRHKARAHHQYVVGKPTADEPGTNASGDAPKHNPLILVGMVAWTAVYYVCFERVGYLVATTVFQLGLLSYFNRKRHKTNIAVALGFTLVFDLLFSLVLGVPMPAGWLSI